MELADTIRLFMNSAEATLQRSCWALRLTGMLYGTSSNLSLIVRCRPLAEVHDRPLPEGGVLRRSA